MNNTSQKKQVENIILLVRLLVTAAALWKVALGNNARLNFVMGCAQHRSNTAEINIKVALTIKTLGLSLLHMVVEQRP